MSRAPSRESSQLSSANEMRLSLPRQRVLIFATRCSPSAGKRSLVSCQFHRRHRASPRKRHKKYSLSYCRFLLNRRSLDMRSIFLVLTICSYNPSYKRALVRKFNHALYVHIYQDQTANFFVGNCECLYVFLHIHT
jgi:hypothetical protein